jgi:hypothetical protein
MRAWWLLGACLVALCLVNPSQGGQSWSAVEQPDLAGQIAAAPGLTTENLSEPVRSSRVGKSYLVPVGEGAARTWRLLQIWFPQYGGPNAIMVANLANGSHRIITTERGTNFHLAPSVYTRGRLYISTLTLRGRQQVCIYDTATDELKLNAIPMPDDILGETHPMALSTDGKIVMVGGHSSKAAALVVIDPDTHEVKHVGAVGPSHAPADCWSYSVAADNTHIYLASGKVPWYLLAYDRQTGKTEVLATTDRVDGFINVGQRRDGATVKVVNPGDGRPTQEFWLYQGKAIAISDAGTPPWPNPVASRPRRQEADQPEVSLASAQPDREGQVILWYRPPKKKPADPAGSQAKAEAETGDGDLLSVPDETQMQADGWSAIRARIPVHAMAAYRLVELPDGRLLGTAGAYSGMFLLDPATGKTEHPGVIHLSHYAIIQHDRKVYMSGYPSSPLFVYDPAKTWTAGKSLGLGKTMPATDPRANPRQVAQLEESGCHKMYAAAIGPDGTVYMGGRWYRNGNHGGIGWWDPATGKTGGLWRDFTNYQVNFMAAVEGGHTIVISAHRVEDQVLGKPKPAQGALFFLDHATKQLAGTLEPMPGIKGPGPILAVAPQRILGWTENPDDSKTSFLYGVDTATRQVSFIKPLPVPLPVKIGSNQQERWDFRIGPDGFVWTFTADGTLLRINPADASVLPVGKLKAGGRIAFAGKDIYLAGEAAIRRVSGIVP